MVTTLRRVALGVLIGALCATVLSGCFIIPLADGRSPFDDPFGSSNADIEKAIPVIEEALSGMDTEDDTWAYTVEPGKSNCEGACQLHVVLSILPVVDADDSEEGISPYSLMHIRVPAEVLRDVLIAVVPAAEQQKVDLRVESGVGDPFDDPDHPGFTIDPEAFLFPALEELFGEVPEYDNGEGAYSAFGDRDTAELYVRTRTHQNVLQEMGLE